MKDISNLRKEYTNPITTDSREITHSTISKMV